jgi:hypothetical protein
VSDVCPGFKERINDILYGREDEEEKKENERPNQNDKKSKRRQ